MVFTSATFLFAFLPPFLVAYYVTAPGKRAWPILVGSYAFYGWWRLDYLAILIGVTAWTYLCGQVLLRSRDRGDLRAAKQALGLGIAVDLGVLAYFKYADFGIDSLNAVLAHVGVGSFELLRFVLPIGISFFVLQAVSYLVDLYRRDAPDARSFVEFSAYLALFPQLIAGPIIRYKDIAHQFRQRGHSFETFSEGARRFMIGFSKKVLIADTIAPIADTAFTMTVPSTMDAWIGTVAYGLQLYFDFSGYSDMAIGLGLMMGFRFLENFRAPYESLSITEFWRRWHISLSSWLRDYLYIPLGGNRRGSMRTYLNLMIVMVLGGLWHGAAWTFVLWGAWHGVILAIERLSGVKPDVRPRQAWLRRFSTLSLVMLGWVLFRSPDVHQASVMYLSMLGMYTHELSPAMLEIGTLEYLVLAATSLFALATPPTLLVGWSAPGRVVRVTELLVPAAFLVAVLRLASEAASPFLYFQF